MKAAWILALGLAGCTPRGVVPQRAAESDSADQVMTGMSYDMQRNGLLSARVKADTAWFYKNRNVTDFTKLTVTFYDTVGRQLSTVTSDRGASRRDSESLDFRGKVVAVTPSNKTLKTEHLVYDKVANLISSDTAYTLTGAEANMAGDSFRADPDFKDIRTLRPRGIQKGQGMLLPGQSDTGKKTP